MAWTLTDSLADFRAAAAALFAAEPARNNLLMAITEQLARHGLHAYGTGQPRFGLWRADPAGPVEGVFVQTPPYGPALGAMPAVAAGELAELLHTTEVPVATLQGETAAATAFGQAWERLRGNPARVRVYERLYRLDALLPPDPAPSGRARLAAEADRVLLVRWYRAFGSEVRSGGSPNPDYDAMIGQRLADGALHIWETDGRPVALAGVSRVVAGISRVGPVYTPPGLRGRGYASGLVAAGSAYALARGAREVLLYTDLANPTSNSIYQKLGYRAVADALMLDL